MPLPSSLNWLERQSRSEKWIPLANFFSAPPSSLTKFLINKIRRVITPGGEIKNNFSPKFNFQQQTLKACTINKEIKNLVWCQETLPQRRSRRRKGKNLSISRHYWSFKFAKLPIRLYLYLGVVISPLVLRYRLRTVMASAVFNVVANISEHAGQEIFL